MIRKTAPKKIYIQFETADQFLNTKKPVEEQIFDLPVLRVNGIRLTAILAK